MRRRSYESDADVVLLQAFNAASIAATGGCGYLHPGDIPHRLFNGNKYFDPAEVMTVWEDRAGVAAWVLVGPRHRSYDAQVRPYQSGRRPAVVVSVDALNESPAGVIMVVPCTTTHRDLPSDIEIDPADSGLEAVSYAKCEDLKSVSERRMIARLG